MLRRSFLALLGGLSAAPAAARALPAITPSTTEPVPAGTVYVIRIPSVQISVPLPVNASYVVVRHGGLDVQSLAQPYLHVGGPVGGPLRGKTGTVLWPETVISGVGQCAPDDVTVHLFGPLEAAQPRVEVHAQPFYR